MSSILSSATTTRVMHSLQSNPVRKLLFISIATLTVPRIWIAAERNKYAGQETAFYELVSTFNNYALPGLTALGTAYVLGRLNNPLGVRTTSWAQPEYIDSFANIYKNSINALGHQSLRLDMRQETLTRFIRSILENLEGSDSLQSSPIKLNEKKLKQFTADIQRLMKLPSSEAKVAIKSIVQNLSAELGSYDRLTLQGGVNKVVQANTLVQHLYDLGREFQKSHTSNIPAEITRNIETIVRKLRQSTNVKTWLSLALVGGLGFAVQFINREITKRRTGQSGFVGYSDFGQSVKPGGDAPSQNPPIARAEVVQPTTVSPLHAATFPAAFQRIPQPSVFQPRTSYSAQSAALPAQPVHFSGLPNLLSSQFLPTVNQMKYCIYPLGLIGAASASRDPAEFRETVIRWGFSFLNFMLVPNLVANLVAHSFKNDAIFNQTPDFSKQQPENFLEVLKQRFQRVNQSVIRSYQDIEAYSKKLGDQLGSKSDEQIQEQLSTVLRRVSPELKNMGNLSPEVKAQRITAAVAKELNSIKNISSISGIAYTCLTLGIGLNLFNIYITNKKRARELAEKGKLVQPPLPNSPPSPAPVGFAMGSPSTGSKSPFQAFLQA